MDPFPFLLLFAPLAAVPKIYLGQIWLGLIFDIIFVLFFVWALSGGRRPPVKSVYMGIAVLLNLIALASVLNPSLDSVYNALHGYRSTGLYTLGLFLPLVRRVDDVTLRKMVRFSIYAGVFSSLNAVRQYIYPLGVEIDYADTAGGAAKFLGDEFQGDAGAFRPFSTFVTSVHLALFLSFSLVAAFFNSDNRLFWRLAPLVLALGIVITFSRTAYVAIGVMVVVLIVAASMVAALNPFKAIFYGVFAAVFGGAIAASSDLVMARIVTLGSFEDVSSFQSRFEMWSDAISNIERAPMGYGTGAASWAFKDSLGLGCDSGYLKVLLEYGWLGGSVFLLFFLWIAFRAFRMEMTILRAYRESGKLSSGATWVLACSTLIHVNLVQMITNQTLEAYPNNFLFWVSCGFVLAGYHYVQYPVSRILRR